jgi:hypothetical protein
MANPSPRLLKQRRSTSTLALKPPNTHIKRPTVAIVPEPHVVTWLYKLAQLMEKNIDDLSAIEALDNGKTVRQPLPL